MRKQIQIRGRIAHEMLVVFGVVAAEKSPGAFAVGSVDITRLAQSLVLPQDCNVGLEEVAAESRGLPHEAVYHLFVVLAEHGGNPIPFGGKIKEVEKIVFGIEGTRSGQRYVYIRDLVKIRVDDDIEIAESEGFGIV